MKIRIKAFATVKDIFEFDERELDVDNNISVKVLLKQLSKKHKSIDKISDTLLFAINEEYCELSTRLKENDLLAIFPPVSGG